VPKFGFDESRYALTGPQVAPEAAGWAKKIHLRVLDQPTIHTLAKTVDRYPDAADVITGEIRFLNYLAEDGRRDDPALVLAPGPVQQKWAEHIVAGGITGADEPVAPLSFFLRQELVEWQTPDAVLTDHAPQAAPPRPHVVNTGRGLARYFQDETPGLTHRLAVNYLIHQQRIGAAAGTSAPPPSPPAQALLWAALDVAISSALLAAWYVKWVYDPTQGTESRHARRPRPVEPPALFDLDKPAEPLTGVLYDASPPPGAGVPSPGTPRHPAYPSGHSTYSAAASTVLAAFFPLHATEFRNLADNIGMARLWGGVHWPSDHTAGRALGRAVGVQVLRDIAALDSSAESRGIQLDRRPPLMSPPPVPPYRPIVVLDPTDP